MKSLLLIRHAKSDWENYSGSDFERPLNDRGRKNAPEMARRLKENNQVPDVLVSSPATRAASTAALLANGMNLDPARILFNEGIYEAGPARLLELVNGLDDHVDFIGLVGHNPGMTLLAENLSGETIGNIPTCGMVLLHIDVDSWRLVSAGTGELAFFDYPKNSHA